MASGHLRAYEKTRPSACVWLERIPSHWQELPGRALFAEKKVKNTGLAETRVLSLSYGQIVIKAGGLGGLAPASYDTYQIVEPGDVIIRATDLQNDQRSLRVGLVRDKGIITSAYLCLTHNDQLLRTYAYLVLHVYDIAKYIYGLGSGLRQNLSYADFKDVVFPVPPPDEQRLIVRYVASLDQKVLQFSRNKRRLAALLAEQRLANIDAAVTGALRPSRPRRPANTEWLGDVPSEWDEVPIVRCAIERADYRGATPEKVDSGVFLVTAKNVRMGWIDYEASREYVREDQYEKIMRRGLPELGDVLLTMEAPLGHVALVDREDVAFAQRVVRFRLDPARVVPEFGLYAFMSTYVQNQLMSRATGSTAAGIKASKLPEIRMALPQPDEQREIVAHLKRELDTIDAAGDRAAREIRLIREYRNRLVTDAVTGNLDVRDLARELADVGADLDHVPTLDMEEGEAEDAESVAEEYEEVPA